MAHTPKYQQGSNNRFLCSQMGPLRMLGTLAPVKLVGLPGSLRRASFSRATLIGLRDILPGKVMLEIRDLQLPLCNEDDDRVHRIGC